MEKLNKIISRNLEIPEDKIADDISYELESNWDSVTHLKMIAEIEEAFNIQFDIDEIVDLETVGKIKEQVAQKIKNEDN